MNRTPAKCSKKKFWTKDAAIMAISKYLSPHKTVGLRPYFCGVCSAWHITKLGGGGIEDTYFFQKDEK